MAKLESINNSAPSTGTEAKPKISRGLKNLRLLIYLYAFLLVGEGALRRWFLPSLAAPLLIVRDPVVILAIFQALAIGLFRWNIWLTLTAVLAVITAVLAMTVGHGNLLVTIFGLRSDFLHIPMIFIIGRAFDYREVCRVGRAYLWISIPMTLLLWKQFHSPADAWINVGVGGRGTSTFDGALGFRRPPGTFSFINGVAQFYTLTAAILFASLLQKTGKGWILPILSSIAVLAAIPVSISRLLFFGVALVAVGAGFSVTLAGGRIIWFVRGAVLFAILVAASFVIPGFEQPREVFMKRWDVAAEAENKDSDGNAITGAIWNRTIMGSANDIAMSANADVLGSGLGLGTNVAAVILSGSRHFLIAESEWARCVGELGLIFGFLFIGLRAGIAGMLFINAAQSARLKNNVMPLILWFGTAYVFVQGQWGQPTAQGFATLGAGLAMAACRMPAVARTRAHVPSNPEPSAPPKKRRRVPLISETDGGIALAN